MFEGNGYIGMSMDGKHGVWLKGERGLDIATDYNPLMQFEIRHYDIKGAVAISWSFQSGSWKLKQYEGLVIIKSGRLYHVVSFHETSLKTL
mgnify:CR=1 FL=1